MESRRPDPIHDELSDEAKAWLAAQFAVLKAFYTQEHHLDWRERQALHNAVYARPFTEETPRRHHRLGWW